MDKILNNKIVLITAEPDLSVMPTLQRYLDLDVKEVRIFSRDEKKQDDQKNYTRI